MEKEISFTDERAQWTPPARFIASRIVFIFEWFWRVSENGINLFDVFNLEHLLIQICTYIVTQTANT